MELLMKNLSSMILEEDRQKTFKNWPFDNSRTCSVKNMAEAGFFYIGEEEKSEPDSVECFFCGKQLDGWEEFDDPWEEHLRHAPYCEFAKLRKTEKELTVEQCLSLWFGAFKIKVNKHFETKLNTAKDEYNKQVKSLRKNRLKK